MSQSRLKKGYFLRYKSVEDPKSAASKIIRTLKIYLMSRNKTKQMQAINKICKMITNQDSPVSAQVLINVDIPGLLCDIMNNNDALLIKSVFACLYELSKDEEFYRQRHSAVVIETTCRTIKILTHKVANIRLIYQGMMLLHRVLSGCEREAGVNLTQVLGVVKEVFKASFLKRLYLVAMTLLRFILRAEGYNHKDILQTVNDALTFLDKVEKEKEERFEKNIPLVTDIMRYSLRYCSSLKDMPLKQEITSLIWKLVKSIVIPFIKDLDISKTQAGVVRQEVACLLTVYKSFDDGRLIHMSNHLAAEGYLTLLPDISLHLNDKAVRERIICLLFFIIKSLGVKYLKLSACECQMIASGIISLPADLKVWPQLLARKLHSSIHLTIIVYLYFVVECSDKQSLQSSTTQLPPLCQYLQSQNTPPSPGLLKALWLLFAVWSLSYGQTARIGVSKLRKTATDKLIKWLRQVPLATVYTHHPALLLWIFSAHVPSNRSLQVNLLTLWLKKRDKQSMKEIQDLALQKKETALCLLEIVSTGSKDVLPQAMSVLKEVGDRDVLERRQDLNIYIWSNLPSALSLLTTPGCENRVRNVCNMVHLACKVVPNHPDIALLLRVTQQIVTFFRNTAGSLDEAVKSQNYGNTFLHAQLFKLTCAVVYRMNQAKDYRALREFLGEQSFLRALLVSLDSNNIMITLPALRVLYYLLHWQKHYNIKVATSTLLTGELLLQLMATKRATAAFFSVNIFATLDVFNTRKSFLAFPTSMSNTSVIGLYQDFQNLTLKQSLSWKCKISLLEHCHLYNPEMEQHLLTHPLNNVTIRLAFSRNGIKDENVLQYLHRWMARVRAYKLVIPRNYARALCRDPLSTIVKIVAEQLVEHDWPRGSLQLQLINEICTIGADIPPQLLDSLKIKNRYK